MSFQSPAFIIPRHMVHGAEGEYVKAFDPPKDDSATPEFLDPTNPVPEQMAAAGFQKEPSTPHTVQRDLMHGATLPTWDNRPGGLEFALFRDQDNPATNNGNYPGATIRVPRGAIFHGAVHGHGPPPHTIHWHGIEPTTINDGVGHCSLEIGHYTYQWQPNTIGTYFYHCHRNTVWHFEFGMYGLLIVEPPDRSARAAANTAAFPQFPGFNSIPLESLHPHAFTVPYDVETYWALDDRDSTWSDVATDPSMFLGRVRNDPGFDDEFLHGFLHDFNSDYWYVTGVPVVPLAKIKRLGAVGAIPPRVVVPPELNSGVKGTQVSVNAKRNQTILVRVLNAAYDAVNVTFPIDAVIIAFDGHALGVPPFGKYNSAFLLPAGTPLGLTSARRFDALLRSPVAVKATARVDFFDSRGGGFAGGQLRQTALIPFTIL